MGVGDDRDGCCWHGGDRMRRIEHRIQHRLGNDDGDRDGSGCHYHASPAKRREQRPDEQPRAHSPPGGNPHRDTAGANPAATPPAIPEYHPSSLVRKSPSSTVLTSPDSVTQVGNFYKDALAKGGWQIRSSSGSAYNASFTAHRANEGVSISVYSRGAGSGISIATHPE